MIYTRTECLEKLDAHLQAQGLSVNTRRAYATDIRAFFDFVGFVRSDGEVVVESDSFTFACHDWIHRERRFIKPSSTARRIASLRKLGEALEHEGRILRNYKAPKVHRGQPHPLPDRMQDVRAMLAVAKQDDHYALIVLGGFCGLRISEARGVMASDFTDDGNGNVTLYVRGKGDKERRVPVPEEALEVLRSIIAKREREEVPRPLILCGDRGARKAISAIGNRAQLKRPIASHDLRMTFGSGVFDASQNLRVTQELLGHASAVTTESYTQVTERAMRAAVEAAVAS